MNARMRGGRQGAFSGVATIASVLIGFLCCVHLLGCDAIYYDADRQKQRVESCANSTANVTGGECDQDGDGVNDQVDQCPHSLAHVYVDSAGCVYDSDNDGVSNPFDRCPGSPQGVSVDASGCAQDR